MRTIRKSKGRAAVIIRPATLRDATYIAANMRDEDWREIECQLPEGARREEAAAFSLAAGEAWIATYRGQPVFAFGTMPITLAGSVLSIWAWGSRSARRVIPAITRFISAECVPRWIAEGATRVEARSIVGHDEAHRWMRGLGARETPCLAWGRRGEDFVLFWWTREDWSKRCVSAQPPKAL